MHTLHYALDPALPIFHLVTMPSNHIPCPVQPLLELALVLLCMAFYLSTVVYITLLAQSKGGFLPSHVVLVWSVVSITTSHTVSMITAYTCISTVYNVLAQRWGPLCSCNKWRLIHAYLQALVCVCHWGPPSQVWVCHWGPLVVCVCHWGPPSQVWVAPWRVTVQSQQKPQ